jgi:DNA-binding CsgD family transcriptional regulator
MAVPRTTESPKQDPSFESRSAASGSGTRVGGAIDGDTTNDDDKPSGVHRQLRASAVPAPDVASSRERLTRRSGDAAESEAANTDAADIIAADVIAADADTPDVTSLRKSWEIVEEFDHEGHRYRLQRRRISTTKGSPLAPREEETLELASEGMNRKQIAKRLGLAPSTVGVLLHRASIKLRARSRNELLSSYRELTEKSRAGQ